jgi:hypothetical protein
MSDPEMLIDKIEALPPDRIADFLWSREQDQALARAAAAASAPAFAAIWNNPEDDVYDVVAARHPIGGKAQF